ncbi:MAG TPA: addiction module protein [Thermoanaerobaculia bacterium]|nr:addiction module protein [Thermoanaerobaculia bacterium]
MTRRLVADPPGFTELSRTEQVEYLQALWDRIREPHTALPVPESHLQLVEERLEAHRRNPGPTRSAFEILDRLAEKTR